MPPSDLPTNLQPFEGISLYRRGWGAFRVYENPNLQILVRHNPYHFLKMSQQIMQGWQRLLMRNSGRLLSFPGELSECINQYSCLHPSECHTTNDEIPLQHFCNFHGKLIIINQILGMVQVSQSTP